jgi:hypothetical protein
MLSAMIHTVTEPSPTAVPARTWPVWVALTAAMAALAVAVTGAVHSWSEGPSMTVPAAPTVNAQTADRQLCQNIGPLLRESVTIGKDFVALGTPGDPARDAGIPVFRAKVHDWADRIQPVLDAGGNPPRLLVRATQRYADDLQLYADNIQPGAATDTDTLAWVDGNVAMVAAVTVCGHLGIRWWTE